MRRNHCDAECAYNNDCTVGGIECKGCGRCFCAYEIGENGICADCEESKRKEEE